VIVGRRISMVWATVIYAGMIVLGWSVKVLLPALGNPEDAFMIGAEQLLSPVLAGVMVAAVLSAIMSTVDSQLLVAASTVSHDLLGDAGERAGSSEAALRRSRVTVLGLSIGAVLIALVVDESIFSSVLFAWTAMGSAFGPVLLVTVLRRRPPATWVLAAMSVGFVLSVAAHLWSVSKGGALERVVPFVLALVISLVGARTGDARAR
jgi:sodium/proline symporter